MICTKCDGTGFMNWDERCDPERFNTEDDEVVLKWISEHEDTDMSVCNCCGDGEYWYGNPGQHYGADDPIGSNGPYSYNGGLCECH